MSQRLTSQAINELAPNAEYSITDGVIDWHSEDIDQPSDEDIKAKKTEIEYKSIRSASYPSTEDQFDKLYHDIKNGKLDETGEWFKAIKKVKDDNPK